MTSNAWLFGAVLFGMIVFAAHVLVAAYRDGRYVGEPSFDQWDVPRLKAALQRLAKDFDDEDRRLGGQRESRHLEFLHRRECAILRELDCRKNRGYE